MRAWEFVREVTGERDLLKQNPCSSTETILTEGAEETGVEVGVCLPPTPRLRHSRNEHSLLLSSGFSGDSALALRRKRPSYQRLLRRQHKISCVLSEGQIPQPL